MKTKNLIQTLEGQKTESSKPKKTYFQASQSIKQSCSQSSMMETTFYCRQNYFKP